MTAYDHFSMPYRSFFTPLNENSAANSARSRLHARVADMAT